MFFLVFPLFFNRVLDIQPPRRPLGFRAGVHKSESAKEMLLSQHMFGALPPSPPSSSADVSVNAQNALLSCGFACNLFKVIFDSINCLFSYVVAECRKSTAFHHYHRCQRKAMPTCMKRKFVPTAIDQRRWAKNMRAGTVTPSKVHRPFHRIDAHQPKIRLKQCKQRINYTHTGWHFSLHSKFN